VTVAIIVSKCPVCGNEFTQKHRAQGGGRRTIYCSPKCRSLDWVRGNGGKRKAAIVKYDAKPESKEAKRLRSKKGRAAKFGWTREQLLFQLDRQGGKCYGCLTGIDESTACIDHDHSTGKVRGLLCRHCNWALGHVRDDPVTLRRLMALLDYQIDRTCVYVTGALKNPRIPEIGNRLRVEGFDAMDEWFTPGEFADTNWQEYEKLRGRTYEQALRGRAATNIALFDRVYLDHSDAVVFVAPAGKSAMLELGYAKGSGKYSCILLDGQQPDRYDIMPGLADDVFSTEDDMISGLKKRFA
jgi:endogenous inhibitor of DNA gyrase (YacG/DUF329 family)